MIGNAVYDAGAGHGDGFIVDYRPDGTVDIESGDSSHYGTPAIEAVERFARNMSRLLISAKYHRGED